MRKEGQGRGMFHTMTDILAGALISLLSGMAVLVAAAWGVSEGWIGDDRTTQITVAACVLGSLLGGLAVAGKHRMHAPMIGAAVGGSFFLFLLSIGSLYWKSVEFGGKTFVILFACICGGTLAGVAARGGKTVPKRKKSGARRSRRGE